MKDSSTKKALNLKTLTKSSVWDVQENDIFRILMLQPYILVSRRQRE